MANLTFTLWATLVLFIWSGAWANHGTLRMAQVVFRHGDRSPDRTFPTDPHQEDAWPQGWGQLSQLGMQQAYELGHMLRKRYQHLISEQYIANEIHAESTDRDRTLMSTECVVAGLFPSTQGPVRWSRDLGWEPVPVHTKPTHTDTVLYPTSPCEKAEKLQKQAYETKEVQRYQQQNSDFLEFITKKSGLGSIIDSVDLEDLMSYIPEPLEIERANGLQLAGWVNSSIYELTQQLNLLRRRLWYPTEELRRLRAGRWLFESWKKMHDFSKNPKKEYNKLYLSGAHDGTLVAILSALGLWDELVPPYCSAVLLELHEKHKGGYIVQLFYHNTTVQAAAGQQQRPPMMLNFSDCPGPCGLSEYYRLVEPLLLSSDGEFHQLCHVTSSRSLLIDNGSLIAIFLAVIASCIVMGSVFMICYMRKTASKPYARLRT